MSTFPGSPRLLKGAIIGVDIFNPLASVVVFQYNPDTMTRRLEPRAAGGDGDRGEALRLAGPAQRDHHDLAWRSTPRISSSRRIPSRWRTGISPTLAALEMMLYPKSALVIANTILSAIGTVEMLPAEGPLILFVWGPTRVLPVRLTSLTITEEAYDTLLNPTRAKAEISLTVLSYNDLKVTTPGHALFLVHQVTKEVMATTNLFNSAQNVGVALRL